MPFNEGKAGGAAADRRRKQCVTPPIRRCDDYAASIIPFNLRNTRHRSFYALPIASIIFATSQFIYKIYLTFYSG